jgi:hypothetical protein
MSPIKPLIWQAVLCLIAVLAVVPAKWSVPQTAGLRGRRAMGVLSIA